jgi:N-acetylglucosaminyldiphosphoundecaprenol N-acetyl-beta-D-mannosaminyltransferase
MRQGKLEFMQGQSASNASDNTGESRAAHFSEQPGRSPVQAKVGAQHKVSVLGVQIANVSSQEAIELIEQLMQGSGGPTQPIYIVNAHTLNLAAESREYRSVLNTARVVFADGTGTRWAARLRGVRMRANLVGTDLIPELFGATAERGYRYFLLGASAAAIEKAAESCRRMYPGWDLAGFHHGFVQDEVSATEVIERINAARPHMLLVGMGNPVQECWIAKHRQRINVPVSIGVGGLFDHWAGSLKRAPAWVRRNGFEWVQLLLQQPHKWRRYLLGNPKFLFRMVTHLPHERS